MKHLVGKGWKFALLRVILGTTRTGVPELLITPLLSVAEHSGRGLMDNVNLTDRET